MPVFHIFPSSLLWLTVLNAFEKSKYIESSWDLLKRLKNKVTVN